MMSAGGMQTLSMGGQEFLEKGLRAGFLLFLALAAWQDVRERSIAAGLLAGAGAGALVLRGGQLWLTVQAGEPVMTAVLSWLAGLAAAAGTGVFLLAAAALTREAVGKGDGWFFLVAGWYLGGERAALLLGLSLLLCLPAGGLLLARGRMRGEPVWSLRLPFLPFAVPAGVALALL